MFRNILRVSASSTVTSGAIGAGVGALIGTFYLPFIGTTIGAFMGAFIAAVTGLVIGIIGGIVLARASTEQHNSRVSDSFLDDDEEGHEVKIVNFDLGSPQPKSSLRQLSLPNSYQNKPNVAQRITDAYLDIDQKANPTTVLKHAKGYCNSNDGNHVAQRISMLLSDKDQKSTQSGIKTLLDTAMDYIFDKLHPMDNILQNSIQQNLIDQYVKEAQFQMNAAVNDTIRQKITNRVIDLMKSPNKDIVIKLRRNGINAVTRLIAEDVEGLFDNSNNMSSPRYKASSPLTRSP